uniref:Uncharacterized protein n=1 Tax=Anguilla anguilla TaxID=7936 RepID=A0A0E9S6H9_ANGAN
MERHTVYFSIFLIISYILYNLLNSSL